MARYLLATVAAIVLGTSALAGWAYWSDRQNHLDPGEIRHQLPEDFIPDPARGEYLYHLGGCLDCHRSGRDDGSLSDSPTGGMELHSPVGTFYPPNITPDRSTGIGDWSLADFVNSMRQGTAPDGRHYYAAFPYVYYSNATIADLAHLKSYLDTLEPVTSRTPGHDLDFPFNIRAGNLLWKAAFHRPGSHAPDSGRSEDWNTGNYIVNVFAHCGMCHTTKGLFFNDLSDRMFAGAKSLEPGGERVPSLLGLEATDIINALDEWSFAISENSPMYAVTLTFSRHLPASDTDAVATYLSGYSR